MPTLAQLRSHYSPNEEIVTVYETSSETLVSDHRARMSPSDVVEQKLRVALRTRNAFGDRTNRSRKPR